MGMTRQRDEAYNSRLIYEWKNFTNLDFCHKIITHWKDFFSLLIYILLGVNVILKQFKTDCFYQKDIIL